MDSLVELHYLNCDFMEFSSSHYFLFTLVASEPIKGEWIMNGTSLFEL